MYEYRVEKRIVATGRWYPIEVVHPVDSEKLAKVILKGWQQHDYDTYRDPKNYRLMRRVIAPWEQVQA